MRSSLLTRRGAFRPFSRRVPAVVFPAAAAFLAAAWAGAGNPTAPDAQAGRPAAITTADRPDADATRPGTPPSGSVLIPGGPFLMGDSFGEAWSDELPVREVSVKGFRMDRTEVTKALWDEVKEWATAHGYDFDLPGRGKGPTHPVHTVNWYDVVKWCNARSEMEGLTPCYYTSAAKIHVYRMGRNDLSVDCVRWDADGYRLPTEAEWEKAARGGAEGRRFPWSDSDTVSHSRANYQAYIEYPYDESYPAGHHPRHATGGYPYTSPVGSFAPNGYGLYDMAGNVWEWCWDWYDAGYYVASPPTDPRGPAGGHSRVIRGGSWGRNASFLRCASRYSHGRPLTALAVVGFRCVRGSDDAEEAGGTRDEGRR